MQLSYQNKLFLIIGCVFLAITVCLSFLLQHTLTKVNLKTIEKQLSYTSQLIDDQLKDKTEDLIYLNSGSSSLDDFAKQLNSLSKPEVVQHLKSLAKEFRADRTLVISEALAVLGDTNLTHKSVETFPHADLKSHNEPNNPAQIVMPLNQLVYYWAIFPIKANGEKRWVAFGYEIEKIFQKDINNISPLNIHLNFAYSKTKNNWHFNEDFFQLLGKNFNESIQNKLTYLYKENLTELSTRVGRYVVFMMPFPQKEDTNAITAVLIYSFDESFQIYQYLIYQVLLLFATAYLLLSLGLLVIGRKYRRAIKNIVNFVEKVDQGEYTNRLPIYGSGIIGKLCTLLNNMVTKTHQRERELLHKTRYDLVTELPNKSFFIEQLNKILQNEEAKHFAIVLITIDRFSQINHALGHRVADRLLNHVGARITSAFQDATFIGKLSGNVYALIMSDITPSECEAIAERVLDLFENPFSVYTVTIDLSAHVGFSFYPGDGEESDVLIQKADVALFLALNKPEHFAVYEAAQDPHQFNKLSLMSELKEGIQNDELVVFYQPKVDLKTDRIIQVEALVRWIHPYKGFMSPSLFVPLAEETGHIKKITLWLISKAFEQCAIWEKKKIPIQISLNLSVKDLLNRNLFSTISNLIHTHQINPTNITFEITESAFMQDPDNALGAIKKLKGLGFSFTIDDFGTGYSSMSYLKQLPVNEIKIDKSFIQDITRSSRDAQIVRSTIELGHSLELKVVAEGIEDEDAYELLKSFNCDIGQGYYMSKPMSLKELDEWLNTSQWGLSLQKDS